MKYFLLAILLTAGGISSAQKFALLDKQMTQPVIFSNTFTTQQSFAGFFPVEKDKLNEFVTALEKIAQGLSDARKTKPEPFKLIIGNTTFTGLKLNIKNEDRLDVVLSSAVGSVNTSFHLCDAKINNSNNAFFVNTWAKYIRGYMVTVGER